MARRARAPRSREWAQRTPWGDPDLQGEWTSEGEFGVPFERPAEFGTQEFLDDQQYAKRLADVRAIFVGGTASLTLNPNRGQAANIQLQPLIQAEKGYFAETDYNTDNQVKLQADAQKAGDVPLTIAASAEKGGSADARVQVNSSRLVVVSSATFVQDNAIMQDQAALDFVSGSVNWLLSREQMIGIAPKIPKPLTFSLDPEALSRLRWIVLVLMPLIPAAIGTVVWWQRRA